MKGLDLSRKYYETYGREMLERDFADILPYIAAGLVGQGSECMGYDDDLSQDHDFEPGFSIFLPGEDVVAALPELDVVVHRVVDTVLQGPDGGLDADGSGGFGKGVFLCPQRCVQEEGGDGQKDRVSKGFKRSFHLFLE